MEYLPNGTALTHVSIPSYDEKRNPTSLFQAEEVIIIDKEAGIMEASNVNLQVLSESSPYTITLEKAYYYYQKSYLEAEQHTMIKNDTITITGNGACYDLSTKELFIKGPARALMAQKEVVKNLTLSLLSSIALLPGTVTAAPPSAPSPEDLDRLELIDSTPAQKQVEAQLQTEKSLSEQKMTQLKSEQKLSLFLAKTGQEELLIKKEEAQEEDQDAPQKKAQKLSVPPGALSITCDDGMYYDAEEGVLVCIKNVEVNERRFNLKCKDQLKIYLTQEKKKERKEAQREDMGIGSADLKELIATGAVKLVYKDTGDMPPVTLTGETAHFQAQTEEITMSGGLPTMQQGQNFIETLEPTWIKISKTGVRLGPGKKRTVYLTEDE